MRILFFDTETTGLPSSRQPLDHDCQPDIVQLAWQLYDRGVCVRSCGVIVNPETAGEVPEDAAKIHGITTEMANAYGVLQAVALAGLFRCAVDIDLVVGHNLGFDMKMLEIAVGRYLDGDGTKRPIFSTPRYCTMEASRDIVKLPPTDRMLAAGFTRYKSPKLEEAYRFLFGESLHGAHDALIDVQATARVYFELQRRAAEGPSCQKDA